MWQIKKFIVRLVIIICIPMLLIPIYILIKDLKDMKEINNSTLELIENVITEGNNSKESIIDWDKLKDINDDIIGWIRISDTNIDYPILKDDNNLKYLNHSYNGKYNKNGSIFTLNRNPFNDRITIIYGHNMKSNIMFSELDKYMNKDFFDKHKYFEIYTKECNYKATIFSCYSIGVNQEENNIKLLRFEDEIEYYKNKSKIKSEENIGEIKKIVKLSTCSYINNHTVPTDQRYYIIAKIEKLD